MKAVVLKFGGTSMSDHNTWKQVLSIIGKYEHPVVVVSATARTTRMLLEATELARQHKEEEMLDKADEIREKHVQIVKGFIGESGNTEIRMRCLNHIEELINTLEMYLKQILNEGRISLKNRDAVASIGERISSYLLVQCGIAAGMNCTFVDARDLITTDSTFGKANPDERSIRENAELLLDSLKRGEIPITGGFYGQDTEGQITTLGFEGSDYTASLLGAAVKAKEVEIWTDVSGVYTSDPRFIFDARPIPTLSYAEATEMAYYGAKVLHPSTLKPLQKLNIPLKVKNMFEPDDPGTRISESSSRTKGMLAISFSADIAMLTANAPETVMGYAFLRMVFETLEEAAMPVEVVTTTEASVSICIPMSEDIPALIRNLEKFSSVSLQNELGLIRLIGSKHQQLGEMKNEIFRDMDEVSLHMLSYSRNKQNMNVIVDAADLISVAQQIHFNCFNKA
jgi:aspartate kinase